MKKNGVVFLVHNINARRLLYPQKDKLGKEEYISYHIYSFKTPSLYRHVS